MHTYYSCTYCTLHSAVAVTAHLHSVNENPKKRCRRTWQDGPVRARGGTTIEPFRTSEGKKKTRQHNSLPTFCRLTNNIDCNMGININIAITCTQKVQQDHRNRHVTIPHHAHILANSLPKGQHPPHDCSQPNDQNMITIMNKS